MRILFLLLVFCATAYGDAQQMLREVIRAGEGFVPVVDKMSARDRIRLQGIISDVEPLNSIASFGLLERSQEQRIENAWREVRVLEHKYRKQFGEIDLAKRKKEVVKHISHCIKLLLKRGDAETAEKIIEACRNAKLQEIEIFIPQLEKKLGIKKDNFGKLVDSLRTEIARTELEKGGAPGRYEEEY